MKMPALAIALSLLSLVPGRAQETLPTPEAPTPRPSPRPEPPSPPRRRPPEPLKVQVTVSRFEGEKKVLSLPNTLLVNANYGGYTKLRMGFEVPVRTSGASAEKDGKGTPGSYQYRNVGINIDCRANTTDDGRYALEGTVEQSSLYTPGERAGAGLPDLPLFRTFFSAINATLRDGQSVTTVAATDPVSGETVRIEVSLTVIR